jgi:hypothetical protein
MVTQRTTLRIVGVLVLALLGAGIGYFILEGIAILQSLFELYLIVAGIGGTIAVQLIVWPERFMPKTKRALSAYTSEETDLSFKEWLQNAEKEVIFVAVALITTGYVGKETVRSLITEKRKRLTFLALDPEGKYPPLLDQSLKWENTQGNIRQTLTTLSQLKKELKDEGSLLEIRTYSQLPNVSLVIRDPPVQGENRKPQIRIGNYTHGPDPSMRLVVTVSQDERPDIFQKYWREYETFRDSSSVYSCPIEK